MLKNSLLIVSIGLNIAFINYVFLVDNLDFNAVQPVDEFMQSAPSEKVALDKPGLPLPLASETAVTAGDEVASYQAFPDQLRSQGISESLVRQLVLARINRDHEQRVLETTARQPYWRLGDRNRQQQLRADLAWEQERRDLLIEIFGAAIVNAPEFQELFRPYASSLGFLSSEKQIRLHELTMQNQARTGDLYGMGFIREYRDERMDADKELQRAALELLEGDEYFEYQLRESHLSNSMRYRLEGFDLGEQEFRDLFDIYLTEQSNPGRTGFSDRPGIGIGRPDVDSPTETRVRNYLGEERYREYLRVQDPVYRTLQSIAERYGNSDQDIIAVYDIATNAGQRVLDMRNNAGLAENERRQTMRQIQADMRSAITDLVGAEVAESVERNTARFLYMNGRGYTPRP